MSLLPPSTPIERQLTTTKWDCVEQFMQMNPSVFEVLVYRTPTDQYWIVRRQKTLVRVHKRLSKSL
jgi:hypothetical protein